MAVFNVTKTIRAPFSNWADDGLMIHLCNLLYAVDDLRNDKQSPRIKSSQ